MLPKVLTQPSKSDVENLERLIFSEFHIGQVILLEYLVRSFFFFMK